MPVDISPVIKHIKCHAGLDKPALDTGASSLILDSRFRGNDGFDVPHREVRQIYPLILLNASFLPFVSSFIISNNQNHRTLIWNVVKTLQQVIPFFNLCRNSISAQTIFFIHIKSRRKRNERLFNHGRKAVLIDGCRIPFLRAGTGYRDLMSYDLGRLAIAALVKRTQVKPEKINRVIMGCVIANLATTNVAREAALGAGLPVSIPAFTVTMACISANLAITTGVDLIQTGQADIVIAGGTESLSDIPICYRKPMRKKLMEAQKYKELKDYLEFPKGDRHQRPASGNPRHSRIFHGANDGRRL